MSHYKFDNDHQNSRSSESIKDEVGNTFISKDKKGNYVCKNFIAGKCKFSNREC